MRAVVPRRWSTSRRPYPRRRSQRLAPVQSAWGWRGFQVGDEARSAFPRAARGSISSESSSAVARSSSSALFASSSGIRSGSSTATVARRTAVRSVVRRTTHSSAWPLSGSPNMTMTVPASARRAAAPSITAPGSPAVLESAMMTSNRSADSSSRMRARLRERRATRSRAATGSPSRQPERLARTCPIPRAPAAREPGPSG